MKKNHSQIAFFMMVVLYKMLTPWKHRVTFPLFYAGDVLTSYTGIIRDVSKIIYSGPHSCWLEFFLVNIPGTARMIQCYKRMQENGKFYPHGVNMLKYVSGYFPTLNAFPQIKNNKVGYYIVMATKYVEQIYKFYWDIIEDWALLRGGTGAQQFAQNKSKWAHGKLCRRPSQFSK